MTTNTFSGSKTKVELILEKLNTAYIDYYSATMHVFRTYLLEFVASTLKINGCW